MIFVLLWGYALGIALASWSLPAGRALTVPLGGVWLVGAGLLLIGALWSPRPLLAFLLLLCGSAGVGWYRARHDLTPAPSRCDAGRHLGRDKLLLDLELVDRARRVPGGHVQLARALAMTRRGTRSALCGRVALWRREPARPLAVGQRLRVRARLLAAMGGRNPGREGVALGRRIQGVSARVVVDEATLVLVGAVARPSLLTRIATRVRRGVEAAIAEPRARGIVLALVLGERSEIDPAQRTAFARTGISHLLAVSGLHLALVALGVYRVGRRLLAWVGPLAGRYDTRRPAAAAALAAAIGYTLLVGAPPSAGRACVMTAVFLAGPLSGRRGDLWRSLVLAAWVLLLAAPLTLLRPAFQLSFAAVIGIGAIGRRPLWRARLVALRRRGRVGRLVGAAAALLSASLGATLLTWPLASHHFGMVSLVGVAINLVAVPWVSLLLFPLAASGAAVALAWPAAGELLLRGAGTLALGLDGLAKAASALPVAAVPWRLGWGSTLALCLLGLSWLLPLRRPRPWRLGLGLVAVIALAVGPVARWAYPRLDVVFLEVGQGDSTLVRLPDGTTVLVDGGGGEHPGFDPGRLYVAPALDALGVRRIDIVVASHPHADHVAGLGAVLEAFPVGELWSCWPRGRPSPWQDRLRAWARRHRVPLRAPRSIRRGGATLRPLWPPRSGSGDTPAACGAPSMSTNDNSIVLRLDYGRSALLLTGDVEAQAEALLVAAAERAAPARARHANVVLKVPHHGSSSSSTPALLRWAAPRHAVISCGRHNRFAFPRASTLGRYRRCGTALHRVDEQGAFGASLWAGGRVELRALFRPIP